MDLLHGTVFHAIFIILVTLAGKWNARKLPIYTHIKPNTSKACFRGLLCYVMLCYVMLRYAMFPARKWIRQQAQNTCVYFMFYWL